MNLEYYEKEFANVMKFRKMIRSYKLASLMTDMEKNFSIPMITSEEFNENHLKVIDLYRRISKARDL